MSKNVAIILAAGNGLRLDPKYPKQYHQICGKALLAYSIERFQACEQISDLLLVVSKEHENFYQKIFQKYQIKHLVIGGATRQESVRNALIYLSEIKPDLVLIHDAARAFTSQRIISETIEKLAENEAVIPVISVIDSVKFIEPLSKEIANISGEKTKLRFSSIKRENLFRIQTPQGFDYQTIYQAHLALKNRSDISFSDDSGIMEYLGFDIATISGDENNFKVTFQDDLVRAEELARKINEEINQKGNIEMNEKLEKIYLTGIGFDVHGFMPEVKTDNFIILAGIKIPSLKKIDAHSDGDVLIHALVDAILGSIGAGDIGDHFPPSDVRYKNADSRIFLNSALKILEEKKYILVNLDSIIIAEEPKIGSYKALMKENLASLTKLPLDRIGVKATTTEHLGFLGRKEGIACQVIVTITNVK